MDRGYIRALEIALASDQPGHGSCGLELSLRDEGSTASPFLLRRTASGGTLYIVDTASQVSEAGRIARFDIRAGRQARAALLLPQLKPDHVVVMRGTTTESKVASQTLRPTLMVCRRPVFRIEHESRRLDAITVRRIAHGPLPARSMCLPAGRYGTPIDLSGEPDGVYRISAGGRTQTFYLRSAPDPVWGVLDLVAGSGLKGAVPLYTAQLATRSVIWRYVVTPVRIDPSAMQDSRLTMVPSRPSTRPARFRFAGRRDPGAFLFESVHPLPMPDQACAPPSLLLVPRRKRDGAVRASTKRAGRWTHDACPIPLRVPTWTDLVLSSIPPCAEVYVHL